MHILVGKIKHSLQFSRRTRVQALRLEEYHLIHLQKNSVTQSNNNMYFCLSEIFKTNVKNRFFSKKLRFEFEFTFYEFSKVIL